MKILLINNVYGKDIRSGAERLVSNLEKELLKIGHEVHVLDCSDKYKSLSNKSLFEKFFIHIFGFFNIKQYFYFKKILKEYNPDLVWSHNLTGFGMISFLPLKKYKLIHSCHDIQLLHPSGLLLYGQEKILDSFVAKVYQFLTSCFLPNNTLLVFPSQWLYELHKKYGLVNKRRYIVEGNPIRDIELFQIQKNKIYTFLYLGQLEEHKGIVNLTKAFISLNRKDVILKIAGEGSLKKMLQEKFNNSQIEYLGNVNNPEKIISEADCVIAPSLCYENAPTVILEAMSQNVPVIASCLGGVGELIKIENLKFIPTVSEIQKSLFWCLNNQTELEELSLKNRNLYKKITLTGYLEKIFSSLNFNL